MKKVIITTILILVMGVGLPVTQVLAAPESGDQATQENTEKNWQKALKTQVELAETKVLLLQARTDLWLEQNREKALRSLDKANASLSKAWQDADQITRMRIAKLKSQIEQAGQLLKDNSQQAKSKLRALSDQSERTLNAALSQAQFKSAMIRDEIATRYALARAMAASLKAKTALEIDKSSEKAQQALQETENYLQQAKAGANEAATEQIAKLQEKAQSAQQAVRGETDIAKARINALIVSTEKQIQTYGETIQESEEAKLLQKRYGQLEAEAALLKANLAAKADATGKQAAAYLDESKAWYDKLKSQVSQRWDKELTKMSARIDEVKQAVERKDKQARAKLQELLDRAAVMFKDDKPAK